MLRCRQIAFATFLIALLFSQNVWAETITVGSVSGCLPGETVQMQVTVDVADYIHGAVFTVSYNQDYLTLRSVTSPFFKTFADQFAEMASPPTSLSPTQVKVNGITYDKPMIVNFRPGSVMLAAARVQAGGGENRLFILEFELAADIPDGGYPVSIGTSVITSTAAGYPAEGIALPLLFPISSTGVVNGMVSVNMILEDADHDGIDDNWEMAHFGNLTTANSTTDHDKDGYTDLQEYFNWLGNLRDSNGAEFDPKVENAPGGPGYRVYNSNFWLLMMPVLMEMNRQ